jgi:PAS domain S-box-containing protein
LPPFGVSVQLRTYDQGHIVEQPVRFACEHTRMSGMSESTLDDHVLKVLVVDDTATNRQILQVFLKKLGFVVITAEDGAQAVARFIADKPDIVLMDVMMPVMDGFEATRRIKAGSGSRWVPVVFLTALDKEEDLVNGLDSGGDDYLTKPISFVVLDAKLRSLRRTLALQNTLEETQRRTQAITDNIVDGVVTTDSLGIIRSTNPAVTNIFGYEASEMVGRNVNTLMPEPYQSAHDGYQATYVGGGPSKVIGMRGRTLEGRRKSGEMFPLDVAVSELQLGEERLFVGIVRDISERVGAETRLQENATRLQQYHDQQQQENALAQEIMERLTLRESLRDPSLQHWLLPAANFSGDVIAAARSATGQLYAMLGDATGHGLSAAISALPAVNVFYGMIKRDLPLLDIVTEINKQLRASSPAGRFFAATLVKFDRQTQRAELWIGGMPDALLLDAQGRIVRSFSSSNLALGIVDDDAGNSETVVCEAGGQLVFFSDGLIEATDAHGHEFGLAKLASVLAGAPREGRLEAVKATLAAHVGNDAPHDDISILSISC